MSPVATRTVPGSSGAGSQVCRVPGVAGDGVYPRVPGQGAHYRGVDECIYGVTYGRKAKARQGQGQCQSSARVVQ